MRNLIVAKAILLDDQDRVLLLQRSQDDKFRAGGQDYPGGGIDPGEELTVGIAREVLEEAGIQVDPKDMQLFYAATEQYKDRSVTRLVFWTRISNPEVKLSFEHEAYHWVNAGMASQEFPHPVYGAAVDYGLKHRLFDPPLPAASKPL